MYKFNRLTKSEIIKIKTIENTNTSPILGNIIVVTGIKSYLMDNTNYQLYLLKPINNPLLANSLNLILESLTFLLIPLLLDVIKHLLLIAQRKFLLLTVNFEKIFNKL